MIFLKRLWAAAPIATTVLGLALAVALVFGGRMVADWVYWNDPARQDLTIKPWMTPRFVAHSWDVPRPVMLEALSLPENTSGRPRNLRDIAEANGVNVDELIAALEAAIAAHRAAHPIEDAQ
ncbi:hypothetical protein [Aliiroseovarius subalbicans]|uniref:hypothetical protein n=1 Tax=Aliiroseovarius subalbicans TaxID=2925840 RepID=UPI001F596E11|nr:hypothetical protein [Aliiroseovarius subalbicans]MCI2398227.1 hypothetical protein [Aliiroseovarius subalbicans]